MKIQYKYTPSSEPIDIELVPGMVLGAVLDDTGKVNKEAGYTVPYLDFAYVVSEIKSDGIYTRDTGHNNLWFIKESELSYYELMIIIPILKSTPVMLMIN
jgi:hypothetical protein